MTEQPKPTEEELYSLLQEANLLSYFPSFIEQGGDDVRQLCEATEEEFQEIVSLVGMSSKPLHVRRFQKVIAEWRNKQGHGGRSTTQIKCNPGEGLFVCPSSSIQSKQDSTLQNNESVLVQQKQVKDDCPTGGGGSEEVASREMKRSFSAGQENHDSPEGASNNSKKIRLTLPPDLPPPAIDWETLDPIRRELVRDYSRIFGRDKKNRKTKSLNHHEELINEAATELCLRDPTLLVRRDELFALSRRIVRDSGYTFGPSVTDTNFQPVVVPVYRSEEQVDPNSPLNSAPAALYPQSPIVPHPVNNGQGDATGCILCHVN